jgi:hypothetical protein
MIGFTGKSQKETGGVYIYTLQIRKRNWGSLQSPVEVIRRSIRR